MSTKSTRSGTFQDGVANLPSIRRRPRRGHGTSVRGCGDARRVLKRGDKGDAPHRLHAQLHEDILGEEDPGVKPYPRGGLRDGALPAQQVLCGRPRPELLRDLHPYFGQHDLGWKQREVLGKVRYMSEGGLKRKAKPDEYVKKVERLIEEGRAGAV